MQYGKRKPDQTSIMFRTYVIAILIVLVAVYGVYRLIARIEPAVISNDNIRSLAQCLSDKGVKMYGTFWCSHCQNQKKTFGNAFELIDYTECTLNGQRNVMNPVCADAGIKSFPTWIFTDGTRQTGEMSFESLAKQAGCPWTTPSIK